MARTADWLADCLNGVSETLNFLAASSIASAIITRVDG
jgi:hypothetical protein